MECPTPRRGMVFAADTHVARKLERMAGRLGLLWEHHPVDGPAGVAADRDVDVIVIDADRPDGLDQVRLARQRWPRATLAAFLCTPDAQTWVAAQRAGADVVANRGALAARLQQQLQQAVGQRRLFPVLPEADLAGRLGLVARSEGPDGPVAIYQVAGAVHVVSDVCPHAGARLSDGTLDDTIVTCPRHGSQFDIATGERMRGPADCPMRRYVVVIEFGQVTIVVGNDAMQ